MQPKAGLSSAVFVMTLDSRSHAIPTTNPRRFHLISPRHSYLPALGHTASLLLHSTSSSSSYHSRTPSRLTSAACWFPDIVCLPPIPRIERTTLLAHFSLLGYISPQFLSSWPFLAGGLFYPLLRTMTRESMPAILLQLQSAESLSSQVTTLRKLKNETIGHDQRKEAWVRWGLIPILAQVLASWHHPSGRNGAANSKPRSDEDEACLQAVIIVGSLAQGTNVHCVVVNIYR